MQGVLELGFSGFLSFVGGGMWVLCGGFVGCVILVLFFVLVRRVWRCVYLRVFSPRRRPALRGCTTFYKLDLRFTYLTRRKS
jgi:hypothetical protein